MAGGAIEETVAEIEAWWATVDDGNPLGAAEAAGVLAELFSRAAGAGADLHDPTPELLRWFTRDLARDPEVSADDYDRAALTLPRYLMFLRAAGRWRRSERTVRACWDVLSWAARRPPGLRTLGDAADQVIADRLRRGPAPDFLEAATSRAFVDPLRATLDALADDGRLTLADVAAVIEVPEDSVALDVWVAALAAAGLVWIDDDVLTPRPEVTDAGGCPPPSTSLVERVIGGLVRAVLDTSDEEALAALVEASGEDGTAAGQGALLELVRFGVLDRLPGGERLQVPEPLRHQVVRAVADCSGCVGTEDATPDWQPVEVPSRLAADAAVDLLVTIEQMPWVRRRMRVLAAQSLEALHGVLQQSLGWRDVRAHVFSDPDGTRRFAPRWLLGDLRADADAAVTDADAVPIGAVLATTGAELAYDYGHLTNPWRLQIRAERVTSGMKEPVAWLDAEGPPPSEPTLMSEQLAPRLPAGLAIPAELEHAWAFMESRGWRGVAPEGHALLAPGPPEARPGVVFSAGLALDDRFEPGSPAASRVLPIAASPDGTRVALWADDDGVPRVVALGPQGEAYVIAAGAADLLRLAAVGYPEVSRATLGRPPASPDAVAGVAEFRAWVQGQLGLPVPGEWSVTGNDGFTTWVASQQREPAEVL